MRYTVAEIAAIQAILKGHPHQQVNFITSNLGDESRGDYMATDAEIGTHTMVVLNRNHIPICNNKLQISGVYFRPGIFRATMASVYFNEITAEYPTLLNNLNSLFSQVEKYGEDYKPFVGLLEKGGCYNIIQWDTGNWIYCGGLEELKDAKFAKLKDFSIARNKMIDVRWLRECGIVHPNEHRINVGNLKLAVININGI